MFKKIILIFILLDNFICNLVRKPFKKAWRIEGKCKQCGKCCHEIGLGIHPALLSSRFTRAVVIGWTSWVFDFYLKGIDCKKKLLIFGCKHVSAEGKCQNYFWRPNVCRNYPPVDYFEKPVLRENCGYKAVKQ